MQPVLLILALGMSTAVVLMVSCDVAEVHALRQDVSSALRTMESMREANVSLIRHTPPGGVRRVVVPEIPVEAVRRQSRPQSAQASEPRRIKLPPLKPKLDLFNFGSWKIREAPEVYLCGNQPQRNSASSG